MTKLNYLVYERGTCLQEMGEKDKEQNQTPAGIYTMESMGKSYIISHMTTSHVINRNGR